MGGTRHHSTSAGRPRPHRPADTPPTQLMARELLLQRVSVQHTLSMRARRDPFQGASIPQSICTPLLERGRAPHQGPSHTTSTWSLTEKEDWLKKKDRNQRRPGSRRAKTRVEGELPPRAPLPVSRL